MNIQDFAKQLTNQTFEQKLKARKQIEQAIETRVGTNGKYLSGEQIMALEKLSRWLGQNMLVGEELCPAKNVDKY